MGETYRSKKFAGDKMALLGLFVLALLAARLVVGLKSVISLSKPLRLPCEELSVSMPLGNGWHNEEQWEFQDNIFAVRSLFALHSGKPTAEAYCRYLLACEPDSHETIFEQRASDISGAVIETGQIETGSLNVDWAHISRYDVFLDVFLAIADLPNERQLNVELRQITGSVDLAERTFKRIVESLDFKDSPLLDAGAEVVSEFKNRGLDSIPTEQGAQNLFFIKDSLGQPIGFTIDGPISSETETQWYIETAGFKYFKGSGDSEERTVFQCSKNLDEFVYKSRISKRSSGSITELTLDESGLMSVRTSGARPEQKRYRLGRAAIPDVLFDQVLGRMIESKSKEILVDVIESDGTITPTLVLQIDANQGAAYGFELKFLDGRGFSEQVFLNEQKQIDKVFLQEQQAYRIERTTTEDIAREFPQYAPRLLPGRQTL